MEKGFKTLQDKTDNGMQSLNNAWIQLSDFQGLGV
jgi:hypothetical protein